MIFTGPYTQKWDELFNATKSDFNSELDSRSKKCPEAATRSSYGYGYGLFTSIPKQKDSGLVKKFQNKLELYGNPPELPTWQNYINSSQIEDRLMLVKTVEEQCDIEVMELWNVLMSFEEKLSSGCQRKSVYFSANRKSYLPDISKMVERYFSADANLIADEAALEKTVQIYEELCDHIERLVTNHLDARIKTVDDKSEKISKKRRNSNNDKVFLRGVQRMRRLEQRMTKDLELLKFEPSFKSEARYLVKDIENVLLVAIQYYMSVADSKSNDVAYRLKVLLYQVNFIE